MLRNLFYQVAFYSLLLIACLLTSSPTNAQDQTLDYASYLGGSEGEIMTHVGTLSDGRIVIAGGGPSDDLPITADAFQIFGDGNPDIPDNWLGIFNSDLTELEYGTYLGGNKGEQVNDLFIHGDKIYMTGSTNSINFPTTPGAHQENFSGGTQLDGFLTVFDSSGEMLMSTYFGGDERDTFRGITVDGDGNIYLCGSTRSHNLATDGAHQTELNTDEEFVGDGLVVKFSAEGELIWSTYFGASSTEGFGKIALINDNQLTLIGSTRSISGLTTTGSHQEIYGGGSDDGLMTSFDLNGNLLWSTYFGGEQGENISSISYDGSGRILISGQTSSETNIATENAFQSVLAGPGEFYGDFFLTLFEVTGEVVWSTYFGGEGIDSHGGTQANTTIRGEYIVHTGHTSSESGVLFGDNPMVSNLEDDDTGLITTFDLETGTPIWSTYFITTGFPRLWGHTVLDDGAIVIVGSEGEDLEQHITEDAFQPELAGGFGDGAIFRVRDNVLSDLLSTQADISVSVFPNPSNGTFHIQCEQPVSDIEVLNYLGQVVYSPETLQLNNGGYHLETKLNTGVYLLKGETEKGSFIRRLVIE